jgi:hypothetical protein
MENTTYYKLLKLSSGDNVICSTEDNCENFVDRGMLSITNPVVLNVLRMPKGRNLVESYVLIPWFSFASNNVYEISTDQIITAIDIKETLVKNYLDYLEQRDKEEEDLHLMYEEEKKVAEEDLSSESEVEDIRAVFENMIEQLGEQNEEEEYEGRDDFNYGRNRRGTRTIH